MLEHIRIIASDSVNSVAEGGAVHALVGPGGFERLQEIENPELAARRMKETYRQKKGYSEVWGLYNFLR